MKSKLLKEFVKEILIIIIGVFIALIINNHIQEKRNHSFVQKSLSLIEQEQNENLLRLQNVIESHEKFIETFKNEVKNEDLTIGDVVLKSGGFSIPQISLTAWDKLLSNHLELVEYDYIKHLSRIEQQVIFLEDIKSRLGEVVYRSLGKSDPESKEIVLSLIKDLERAEVNLVERYESFGKLIKKEK